MSVCDRGEKADELIERSKVEQSMTLRKPQTVWCCVESVGAQNSTAGSRESRFMSSVCFVHYLCVFLSIKSDQCVLVVELWLVMSLSGLGSVAV